MSQLAISINYATPAEVLTGTRNDVSVDPYTLKNVLTTGTLYPISIGALSAQSFVGPGTNIQNIINQIRIAGVPIEYSGTTLLISPSSGTGVVTISAVTGNLCPPWYVGQLNQPLLSATNAVLPGGLSARFSKQVSLSADFLRHLQFITSQNPPMTGAETVKYLGHQLPQTSQMLNLLDGRIFFNTTGTTARIYNPRLNTFTTPSGGTISSLGACVMSDGRVFIAPFTGSFSIIYNPTTNTVTTPIGSTNSGTLAFFGAVTMADGRVYCIPGYNPVAHIYDPVTNTVTTPAGTFGANDEHLGGCLLPDGRVFCNPRRAVARIYNPTTNTLTTPFAVPALSYAYDGSVSMADGRIFLTPRQSVFACIYDPISNTLSTPGPNFASAPNFIGGCLLPDGRVFCSAFLSLSCAIYNPTTNRITVLPIRSECLGATLIPDGRVLLSPYNAPGLSAVDIYQQINFSNNALTGPFLNRSI